MSQTPSSAPARQEPPLPGRGLLGWLGRQVGYIRRAVKHPVEPPAARAAPDIAAAPPAQTIYTDRKVIEQPMPGRPEITLRRTVIDEAIVARTRPGSGEE